MTLNINEIAVLTTDHSASSYNIPVLVIEGQAYGRNDVVPTRYDGEFEGLFAPMVASTWVLNAKPNYKKELSEEEVGFFESFSR